MARSKSRFVFGALCAAIVPVALACNGIIGLNDYDKVQCSGLRCADGGDDFDVVTTDVTNDRVGPDASIDATGAKPVSWARFKMPNYDGGGSTNNLASYQADGTQVEDKVTGRFWLEPMPQPFVNTARTYADALKGCDEIAPKGTWRLPSRIELVTLLDQSRTPTINPVFATTSTLNYWTSSEVRPLTTPRKYWLIDFSSGELKQLDENQSAAVRCVRAK